MRIDGKEIAQQIFEELKHKVDLYKSQGITPHLVVILVGDDPASKAYVRQKELKANAIGAKATTINLESTIHNSELIEIIQKLNNDPDVHGIIVQRPLPKHIDSQKINEATSLQKDIDAFLPDSPFTMPLAAAVLTILKRVSQVSKVPRVPQGGHNIPPRDTLDTCDTFKEWLRQKTIVVIGKGETGGGPTIQLLKKMGIEPIVIDSKTENPNTLMQQADIIISTVGRPAVIKPQYLKRGVILVGVGMYRGEDGKLHGDYEEDEVKDIASFYTPIPGGVGPVNVAMLLANLLQAAGQKSL